jgi:hypothetical protein
MLISAADYLGASGGASAPVSVQAQWLEIVFQGLKYMFGLVFLQSLAGKSKR